MIAQTSQMAYLRAQGLVLEACPTKPKYVTGSSRLKGAAVPATFREETADQVGLPIFPGPGLSSEGNRVSGRRHRAAVASPNGDDTEPPSDRPGVLQPIAAHVCMQVLSGAPR